MDEEELTGRDYMNHPLIELASHPDFSHEAFATISMIMRMTTAQLENLKLIKGVDNG